MTDPAPQAPTPIHVHGLLVCRRVETNPGGDLTLHNVVEVVPVESFPGDAGPLVFVAFVRNLPPGKHQGAFVIHPAGRKDRVTARLPVEATVPEGFASRQVALQLKVPSIPVQSGGWYDVLFEWEGRPLAVNRFAIGERARTAPA
jgi:hypothetical protein